MYSVTGGGDVDGGLRGLATLIAFLENTTRTCAHVNRRYQLSLICLYERRGACGGLFIVLRRLACL